MKNVRLVFGCVLGVLLAAGLIVAAGLSKQETKSWQKIDIKSQVRNGRLYALKTFLNNYGIDDVRAKRNMFGLKELLGDYRSQNRLLDDLSPAQDAWSRPDIPLHALAMLKNECDGIEPDQPGVVGPMQQIAQLKEKGFPLVYVGDVVGTGSSRKSATNRATAEIGHRSRS